MTKKTSNLRDITNRRLGPNTTETKPFGLCSDCYKRNTCNVITQTNAVVLHCVYK